MVDAFNQFLELIKSNTTFAIIVVAIFVGMMLVSLTIIFYKIRVKAWKAFIPIYNIMALLEVLGIPVWMILVMFIPFVNIVGIPIMLILMGWKLGKYCRKGIIMRLGLAFLFPIFIPLLSLCYIDIDGTGDYEIEPAKIPDEFALDVIEVSDVQVGLSAMSLTDSNIMDKIAPPNPVRETVIPIQKKATKKDFQSLDLGPTNNEVEDLTKILPTADDLTFDYNSLYDGKKEETPAIKKEEPKEEASAPEEPKIKLEPKEETPSESKETLDYSKLYSVEEEKKEEPPVEEPALEEEIPEPIEEEVEEEPTIVIHDVVLEAAEPVTDNLGPIPINRRYDSQMKKEEKKAADKKEEASRQIEEMSIQEEVPATNDSINPLAPPVISAIEPSVKETVEPMTPPSISFETSIPQSVIDKENKQVDEGMPMQAVNPFGEGEMPSLADIPDLTLPEITTEEAVGVPEVNISEFAMQGLREQKVVEAGTRVDQIVSMNIAEPTQLPVGIITKPTGAPEPQPEVPPAPPVESIPIPAPPEANALRREMTRAEAMGIKQAFFTDVVPAQSLAPQPAQMNMPPATNIFTNNAPIPVNNVPVQPQPMMQQPMGQAPVQPPMNYNPTNPMQNGNYPYSQGAMPNMMAPNPMMQQQPPTAIFQTNTNGAPLLRPVENAQPAEKNCPVCGVKLKSECPICIMCGYKF